MSIKDLQLRFAQVGVIRLGEQLINPKTKKPYPSKLTTFRITSPSQPVVDGVAKLYGGQVRPWQSNTGPQWEVITDAKEVPVYVPPQTIDPNYELWGNGFRARLCDGETESIRNTPCLCLAQFGPDFTKTAPPGQACKPTTRLSLMLAAAPGLGTFKVESHGWNAAAELPMLSEAIANAPRPIPARLEIQPRQKKILHPDRPKDKQIETRSYLVPVLHFDFVSPAQAFSGQIGSAAQAALGAAKEQVAIGSKAEPAGDAATTVEQFKKMADRAKDPATVRTLWNQAKDTGKLTDELKAYLTARGEKLGAPVRQAPASEPAAAPAPAEPTDVVDAETEPDGQAVWQEILLLAHERGWNRTAVAERFESDMGFDYRDDKATGWALAEFRDSIKNGAVQ